MSRIVDQLHLDTRLELIEPYIADLFVRQGSVKVHEYSIDMSIEDPGDKWEQMREELPPTLCIMTRVPRWRWWSSEE